MKARHEGREIDASENLRAEQWFARCNGIRRMGPFASQVLAVDAIRNLDGEPSDGAFVWTEAIGRKRK